MSEDDEEAPGMVIVCQGPPCCTLEGDEAIEAAKNGCPWCQRMTLLPNGEWHVQEPGHA